MSSVIDLPGRDALLAEGPKYTCSHIEPAGKTIGFEVRAQTHLAMCVAMIVFLLTLIAVQLLPEATLRQVLSFLPLSHRIRSAELVCKQWRQALQDQQVMSVLDFSQDELWKHQVHVQPALSEH